MELDPGARDLSDVAARGLERIPELDAGEPGGAAPRHVVEERAVSETELEYAFPPNRLEVEWAHPLHELRAGIGRAGRKAIPRLGEGVRGFDVFVSHGRDEET